MRTLVVSNHPRPTSPQPDRPSFLRRRNTKLTFFAKSSFFTPIEITSCVHFKLTSHKQTKHHPRPAEKIANFIHDHSAH